MTELWPLGLTGAAAGVALALPAFRLAADPAPANASRLLGWTLVGLAALIALVALRHGETFAAPIDLAVAHLVNLLGLAVYPLLVGWVRLATGRPVAFAGAQAPLWIPFLVYPAAAAGTGGREVPFVWLLPVAFAFSLIAAATWAAGRRDAGRGDLHPVWPVGGVVAFSLALNVAQAIRTFWPEVVWFREVVPLTATIGFLVLGSTAILRMGRGSIARARGSAPQYARSALDDAQAAELLERLDRAMTVERLYTRPALTLGELASSLGTAPHTLSEALNRVRGTSLTDYLGRLRVDEARRLLADSANDHLSIEGIALEAGFASRSAFYKTFRQLTGLTPTAFKAGARR